MTEEQLKQIEEEKLGQIDLGIEEYKALYDKGLELLKTESLPKSLMLNILDDYQERLEKMPAVDLSVTNLEQLDDQTREQVRSLVMFGTQAALVKENSEARRKLETANRNYRDLLSVITHEFKNSLTSIYGYNRIIKKRVEESDYESIPLINKHVDRLTRNLFGLVETLFSMSLLEQGKLEIEHKIFDIVEDCINPVLADLELRLEQKKMQVLINSQEEKNIYYGDDRFFQLVFRNLIQNAIQYGYAGTDIEIDIEVEKKQMHISVFNRGSGVPKNKLDRVFEKFFRFHTTQDKLNVGVGLFTVKSIVELHNGTIYADSEPAEWMRFNLTLPMDVKHSK